MADLKNLTPELKTKLAMFQRACVAQKSLLLKGYDVMITQGFRSPEYQNALYAQGRTKPGKIVTNLMGTGKNPSKHCLGKAFDICFVANKKAFYPPVSDKVWDVAAEIGKKCGLTPGRFWKKFVDSPHFEC